ncbi:hypothetical protein Salat_1867900 [Sesamum alatum]|uniref:DUF4283 domain-containing protein n=1 Tax=Sesamum alatum TaxID=300844 RepID=A0AAE2CHY7_9LAMI|nr:hypothetical protein Salat_1867900 [Sesamum alatum]
MDGTDPINNLITLTSTLEVSDDEDSSFEAHKNSPHYPIIAKSCLRKPLNHNAIKSTLIKAWGLPQKTTTNVIEHNTVVFLLNSESNYRQIERQSPWSISGRTSLCQNRGFRRKHSTK